MVGGHDHQSVAIAAREFQRLLHRGVEIDGLADLAARVGRMIALVDRCALDLQEEPLARTALGALQQINGLGRHISQLRHLGSPLAVGRALGRRLQVPLPNRGRTAPAHRHVAVGEQAEHRLVLVGLGDSGQFRCGADNLVSAFLRLYLQRLAGVFTAGRGLTERRESAAERHVRTRGQQLLGDRSPTALCQRLVRAFLRHLLGPVAAPRGDVREQRRRGGVLDLGRGDITGGEPLRLGQLEDALVRGTLDIDTECPVVGLGTRGPTRGAGRRIGDVVGLAVLAQCVRAVLPGQRQRIQAFEKSTGALLIVAGNGDLGITHAVADEQNDVARLAIRDSIANRARLITVESPRTARGAEIAHCRARHGIAVGCLIAPGAGHQWQRNDTDDRQELHSRALHPSVDTAFRLTAGQLRPQGYKGEAPRRCSKISEVWVPATSWSALRFSTTNARRSSVSRAATCRMKSSAPARK